MRAEELNADLPTVRNGKVRQVRGYAAEDIDQETGNPKPGAVKVSYEWGYDIGGGVTVTGAWSLRMFVLAREPPDTHEKWDAAKKLDLVAQVSASCSCCSMDRASNKFFFRHFCSFFVVQYIYGFQA